MKNIYLIPTDQPSMLHKAFDEVFILSIFPTLTNGLYKSVPYFLYITSDDEIKKGDWVLFVKYNTLHKAVHDNHFELNNGDCKKINLTTEPTLIADGVQAIDNMFLEWFVNNTSCEFVEVEFKTKQLVKPYDVYNEQVSYYKIIAPKEEPKQETLEEAAEKWTFETNGHKWSNNDNTAGDNYGSFIAGAKYQAERMYSEEEVLEILFEFSCNNDINKKEMKEWFEQFKKVGISKYFCECGSQKDQDCKYCTSCNSFNSI
jgi:hypothetical protein